MWSALLVLPACASSGTVTVDVWTSWPGASIDELEAGFVVPLERVFATVDPHPVTELVPGLARTTLDVAPGAVAGLAPLLRSVAVPEGAVAPWLAPRATEVTTFFLVGRSATLLDATADLVEAGLQRFGPGSVWASTDVRPVWTATLVATDFDPSELPWRGGPMEEVLASAVGGRPLRERLAASPVPGPSDRRAEVGGSPASVVHVAGSGAAFERLAGELHPDLELVPWPTKGRRVDLWGADAEARADAVVAAAHAAGADPIAVIRGRSPLAGGRARRVEVVLPAGGEAVLAGEAAEAFSAAQAQRFAEGGVSGSPPPGPEWDVTLDGERLAFAGLTAQQASFRVHVLTAGLTLPVDEGLLRLRSGSEPSSAEALAAALVDVPAGAVPLSTLGAVRTVEVPRHRVRSP